MQVGPPRLAALALAAFASVATAGCGSPPASAPPRSTQEVTLPPPPTIDQQLNDAVTRYSMVYSSVNVSPRQDLSVVDTVATGQGADSLRSQAKQVADQHLIVGGALKVLRVTVMSLTPNPPVASSPATATVKSCNDVSSVTGSTPDGKSVVDPKRGPQTQTVLTLTNATPANAAAWRVSTVEPSTTPCDPS